MIRLGINGLGRIGRGLLRRAQGSEGITVAAVNDKASPDEIAYLLRHDSLYGKFPAEVKAEDHHLQIGATKIPFRRGETPDAVAWGDFECDIVVEATGKFRTKDALAGYLKAGAKRVLISGPCHEADKTVVFGVNHGALRSEDALISNASCTTNGMAPVLKVLADAYGVESAMTTTVNSYTNSQVLVDSPTGISRHNRA